jgi:hypothetical protein
VHPAIHVSVNRIHNKKEVLMSGGFLEVRPREFNPMSVTGLTSEARDGVNAALEALSTWRNELADTNEKNGKRVHRTNGCCGRHARMARTGR